MMDLDGFLSVRNKHPMKSSLSCRYFLQLLCLILISAAVSAFAQKEQQTKAIDLDEALAEPVLPNRAASYYHYALAKWNDEQGDLPKALSEMQIALRYNEDSSVIHFELAVLLEKSGNTLEAIEHALEASRLDPKDPNPHWLLANIYFKPQMRGKPTKESIQKALQELETLSGLTPDDPRIYYALGGAYFELEEPEKAIQAYEKFQSLAPNTDNGYREIAKYYDRQGNDEKTLEYLLKGLKIQPDSGESLFMLGSLYSKLNEYKEAVPVYRKLLKVMGNNIVVSRQLAASLIEIGENDEAVSVLNDILKTAPKDKAALILLGRAQTKLRKFPQAIETFQSVVDTNPDDIEAQFYLGMAYEQSGLYPEAVKTFSKLVEETAANSEEAEANRAVFQQHLAANYQEMGDIDKAIGIYEEMIQASPDPDARLYFLLINAYRIHRQFDKALSLGKEQFEKNPDNTDLGIVYARTLADYGKTREGAEILSKLLQSDPLNVDIYVNLSQVYLQGKEYDDAKNVLYRAADRDLDSERLKFQLATVYERQKDFDRAESLFKEILEKNPNNAVALNYIGYMLADRGVRLQEALQYVKEALAIDPNNGAYLDSLGWAFFKLNDLENAEKYLLQARQLIRNDPVIDDHLGELYFKAGDFKKAEDFWMQSIRIGTEPEDIQRVREKLKMLQKKLRKEKP
jgi:tetratricopeptide (TPR) repeat protein